MEGRMTVCNMSIEWGAKAGLIAPDQTTFDYIEGRPEAPKGADWDAAVEHWKSLVTDDDAVFDKEIVLDASEMTPFVTWGTNPGQGVPLGGAVPDPAQFEDPDDRIGAEKALEYMALEAGTPMREVKVDTVFVGSCTNGRIEDLRLAAEIIKGRTVDKDTRLLVVPGSVRVRMQAEDEGLDIVFKEAGGEWRGAGLLDVPRHEPRPAHARASAAPRRPTATSRDARARAGAPTSCRCPVAAATAVRGTLSSPADLDTAGGLSHGEVHHPHRRRRPAATQQRRHRPDHPGGLPQARHAHRLRGRTVRCLAQRRELRAQPAGVRRGHRARRRSGLRDRAPHASTPCGRCRTTASRP